MNKFRTLSVAALTTFAMATCVAFADGELAGGPEPIGQSKELGYGHDSDSTNYEYAESEHDAYEDYLEDEREAEREYRNDRYHRRHNDDRWGQPRREIRELKRDAIRACKRAIRYDAQQMGFRDIDFDDDRRVRQIGPYGFHVHFDEVEFEGRRREIERRVDCTVRRGRVRHIEGIPQPRRYRGNNRDDDDWDDDEWDDD